MNLIPEIAEKLGVELGEEFEANGKTVKFTLDGLYHYFNDGNGLECWKRAECTMYGLLHGEYEVKKPPFEPKDGEKYWFIGLYDEKPTVMHTIQCDAEIEHYERKYCGNKFRSHRDAYDKRFEIYEKLMGKKWEQDDE